MFGPLRRFAAEIAVVSPRKAALSIVLMGAMSLTEGMGLLLLMPLLQLVGVQEVNTLPNVTGWFAWFLGLAGVAPTLGSVLLLYVAISGARTLLQRWQAGLSAAVREDFAAHLRARVYRAIAGAEWRFLVNKRPADFSHVLAGEIGQLGAAAFQVVDLAVLVMVSTVYVALAIHLSPVMAGLVVTTAAVLGWAVRGTLDTARAVGGRATKVRKHFYAAIAEHVGSIKTARMYGAQARHQDHFIELSNDLRDLSLQANAGETELQQSLEFGSVAMVAVIVFISLEVLGEPAAPLLVLLFTFGRLMPRLMTIYRRLQSIASALPVHDDVVAFERECLSAAEPTTDASQMFAFAHLARFENVTFSYLGRSAGSALRGLTLDIPAGLTTAIVGSSGAGKTTVVDLLIGLLPPTSGQLVIDGEPLTPAGMADWRQQIGYVPQDTYLFHDTIRGNLCWARPGSTDAEIWEALHLASGAMSGEALAKKVSDTAKIVELMQPLTRRVPMAMVEAAALSNLFAAATGGDRAAEATAIAEFTRVLNSLSPDMNPWQAEKTEAGIAVMTGEGGLEITEARVDEEDVLSGKELHALLE